MKIAIMSVTLVASLVEIQLRQIVQVATGMDIIIAIIAGMRDMRM